MNESAQKENKTKNEKNPEYLIAGKPTLAKLKIYVKQMNKQVKLLVNNLSVIGMNLRELSNASDKRFLALEAKWKSYEDDEKEK